LWWEGGKKKESTTVVKMEKGTRLKDISEGCGRAHKKKNSEKKGKWGPHGKKRRRRSSMGGGKERGKFPLLPFPVGDAQRKRGRKRRNQILYSTGRGKEKFPSGGKVREERKGGIVSLIGERGGRGRSRKRNVGECGEKERGEGEEKPTWGPARKML